MYCKHHQLVKYFKNILQYNFMSLWYYLLGFFSAHCIKETWLPRTYPFRFSYFFILCLRGCFLRFVFVISRTWCQWGWKLDSPCHSAPKVSFVEQCGGICFLRIIYFLFEYFFYSTNCFIWVVNLWKKIQRFLLLVGRCKRKLLFFWREDSLLSFHFRWYYTPCNFCLELT